MSLAVIGAAFSGADIAADAAASGAEVTLVASARTAHYYLSRWLGGAHAASCR